MLQTDRMWFRMGHNFVRIGSRWAFDKNSFIGYCNIAERLEDLPELRGVFQIIKNKDNEKEVIFFSEVPVGVVRRALHIVEMMEKGII